MAPVETPSEREGELNHLNLVKHSPMKVNLAGLIDFMLQKTYHDLIVMAELLPRKSDIERKIAIIEFATKSRQQFVRLLALVKWAASAERVDKCQVISSFLDQQSFLFVDTADTLSQMARETLVSARLPAFCLPAAVDVLTTETYSRLPTCIRDRIVPADPITGAEKVKTLHRLGQVIQQRLVTSKLPSQMSHLVIADGRVKFIVKDEFEATLTLMGDDPSVPWRLLAVDILVRDFKTGDGKTLVHGLQVQYIHQLAQSRLFTEECPLIDLYNCLHSFCCLLQLEVLHSQAQRLVRERWSENVRIEYYMVGQRLTISYWRNSKQQKNEKESYNLSIVIPGKDKESSLNVRHSPPLKPSENTKNVTVSTSNLCIETILSETIQAQSLKKLETVRDVLQNDKKAQTPVSLDSKIPQLHIETHVTSSTCFVFVNSRTGEYDVTISNCEDTKLRLNCKNSLNKDVNNFVNILKDIRCSLRLQLCIKSVQNLSTATTSLPLVNLREHSLSKLSKHKLFMKFKTHSSYYLVMEVKIDEQNSTFCENYFLLKVKPCCSNYPSLKSSHSDGRQTSADSLQNDEKRLEGFFLKANEIVKLDSDIIADLTSLPNHDVSPTEARVLFGSYEKSDFPSAKRMKTVCDVEKAATSVPRVDEIFSICDTRIPFLAICNELHKAKVPYHHMHKDGVDLSVRILDIRAPSECNAKDVKEVKKDLLDCIVSYDIAAENEWRFDLVMANPPFKHTQTDSSQHVLLSYKSELENESSDEDLNLINVDEKSVWNEFLDDWKCICHLYKHAKELDEYLQDTRTNLAGICSIHSFSYKELIVAYGPGFLNLVTITWSETERAFVFAFAYLGAEPSGHQHEVIAKILQVEFSKHYNLPYVIQILHDTLSPFQSLSKLSTTPSLQRASAVVPAFTVIPQSSTRARVSFKNYFVLEFHFRAKQLVSIRDCSYNQVHIEKCKATIQPINSLKAFLKLYNDGVAEAATKNTYALIWDSFTSSPSVVHDVGTHFGTSQRTTSRTQALQGSSLYPMGYNEIGGATPRFQVSVPRRSPLTSLNLPVPSPAIPMSPTISNYLCPSPAAAHFNPAPSPAPPYVNPLPSPYMLSVASPATPQACVPSPAVSVTSPGSVSWTASPQLANAGAHHQRLTGTQRVPVHSVGQAPSTGQQMMQNNPQRKSSSWSLFRPVLLSHANFDKLMTPTPVSVTGGCKLLISPFEQFLGCQFLLKYLPRLISTEMNKTPLQLIRDKTDLTGIVFKTKYLQFTVLLDTTTYTALHLKVQPLPGQENAWNREEIADLETFFETKVVCYPYKLNNVTSFLRLVFADLMVLKDCIQIIRLELNNDPTHRWNVEWCLTIPPGYQRRKYIGAPAVVMTKNVLFFIQLTKARSVEGHQDAIIVPILYYLIDGTTKSFDAVPTDSAVTLSPHTLAVINHLNNWNDTVARVPGACTIYPAVMSLLKNLVVPV